jgi:myo-inositol-1(or 4)-monophosphatase
VTPPSQTEHHDLGEQLRQFACDLALQAGALILEGRRNGVGSVDTKSTATDLVTVFDRASEDLIVGSLRQHRPNDGIVGEEGTSLAGVSGIDWLIDPIDGTTNFFYGLPGYAVSIGARDSLGSLAGAVFVPTTNELFSAARGHGAWLNGERIGCSGTAALSQALIATGFSYQPDLRRKHIERLQHIIGEVRDIRRFGAAAPDLCYVAAGRVDAYFEEHLGPWDLAAGELIAREAGCISGDLSGGPVRPAQVLVSNPALFEPLRALINKADEICATKN